MNSDIPPEAFAGEAKVESLRVEHTVYYTVLEPEPSDAGPPALLLALHGYGMACKSFIRNFGWLRERNILVVAPQGPSQFRWEESGGIGFGWLTEHKPQQTIEDQMSYMRTLFEKIRADYKFDEERVFTLGFSQGVPVAYRVAASDIVKVKGVVSCAGKLPEDIIQRMGTFEEFPVLLIHGRGDESVPIEEAEQADEILSDGGFEINTHYFDGYHDLPPDQVDVVVKWIETRT